MVREPHPKDPQSAIEIIERAKTYALMSNEAYSYPISVGNRKKLEFVLKHVKPKMVIATSGNSKRCIIVLDYNPDELKHLIESRKNEA